MSRLVVNYSQIHTRQANPTNLSPSNFVSINLSARSSYKKRILLTILVPPVPYSPRCVTGFTNLLHLEGLQHTAIMSTTTATGGDEEFRSSSQHSPSASQREEANNTPTETNRTGRVGGYFTLGYKEGFSQWVSHHRGRRCMC